MTRGRLVAVLDVGTNTVRLLVAALDAGGRLTPRRYALRITRLGGGATPAGLAPEAIERTVTAVAEFAALARGDGATIRRAVATSAAREAPNARRLLERAWEAAGVRIEVISGDEEAALALAGVRWSLGRLPGGVPERFAVVDIGGGSTEVVLAERAAGRWRHRARSMPIGTVRLVERHLRHDPPGPAELDAMAGTIRDRVAADLGDLVRRVAGTVPLVGTAGAITTLAAMDLGLATYDRARIDGHRLTRRALEARLAQVAPMPAAARLAIPGLEPGREDLVVPGLAILLAVMGTAGAEAVTVVDGGLLEGICLGG